MIDRSTAVTALLALVCVACGSFRPPAASVDSDTRFESRGPDRAASVTTVDEARALRAAQDPPTEQKHADATNDDAVKQANNPLANMKAFNLQNYYAPDVSDTDASANTFWIRYAQPISTGIGDWLMRASVPLSTVPTGMDTSESGLGDSNVFATYLFDTDDPAVSFGAGPLLGIPTGTDDATGTDQWSGGAAVVVFDSSSPAFQYGGLITYQHKFAGSDRAPDVNLLAVQPFGFVQLGDGMYLRNAGIWAFNLQNGSYSVPFGFGIGKVLKHGNKVINLFIEPQFTLLHEGEGQPLFQVFMGFNLQFLGE